MAHGLPHARCEEVTEIPVDGPPGWKRRGRWQVPPLAPRAHDIEQAVEHPPHVRRPWSAARLRRREEWFDQAVLLIAQGLAAPEVSNQGAFLGRPHRRSPSEGLPPETATGRNPRGRSTGDTNLFKRALRRAGGGPRAGRKKARRLFASGPSNGASCNKRDQELVPELSSTSINTRSGGGFHRSRPSRRRAVPRC